MDKKYHAVESVGKYYLSIAKFQWIHCCSFWMDKSFLPTYNNDDFDAFHLCSSALLSALFCKLWFTRLQPSFSVGSSLIGQARNARYADGMLPTRCQTPPRALAISTVMKWTGYNGTKSIMETRGLLDYIVPLVHLTCNSLSRSVRCLVGQAPDKQMACFPLGARYLLGYWPSGQAAIGQNWMATNQSLR